MLKMMNWMTNYLRSAVLEPLSQYLCIVDERLLARQDPDHPGEASLEEPDELVQVVKGDVEGLGGDQH